MSRGLLEHCIRQCTLEAANIELRTACAVRGLIGRNGVISGVIKSSEHSDESIAADFVVDAGGRGSGASRWLRERGYTPPRETLIGVDFAYSSARFSLSGYSDRERAFYYLGRGPADPKMAFLTENEGGEWLLSIGGRFGDYPPTDEDGFRAFAKSLGSSKVYDIIEAAERVSEISHYRFPNSLRRHYELVDDLPERFIVMGDGLASFNPLYAQGMTSGALQAQALQDLLNVRAAGRAAQLDGLQREFFRKAAEVVETPWMLAAHSDFAYPQTKGDRPSNLNEGDLYMSAVEALSADDIEIQRLIWEVFSLAKPLSTLYEEPLRSRTFAQMKTMQIS
jgi:2-polyprenyl-6-methoxyphenol hydroxylase-like FAD-dependent oxidoreductase